MSSPKTSLFRVSILALILGVAAAGCVGFVVWYVGRDLPDYRKLSEYQPPIDRAFVSLPDVPPLVIHAFLSAEDPDFYIHPGVDLPYVLRVLFKNALHYGSQRRPIGASTITQQLVKNMLLSDQVSLARKIKEALLALRIEREMSKDRILELYLNEIYLGCGAHGIAEAARSYFGKPLDALTIAEAALLAGLPKAPNRYNPVRAPEVTKARRDWVLDRMAEDGNLTSAQAAAAKKTPIRSNTNPDVTGAHPGLTGSLSCASAWRPGQGHDVADNHASAHPAVGFGAWMRGQVTEVSPGSR